jgi:hypothetical protein
VKIISFDPGAITGWAIGNYDDETPFTLDEAGVITFDALGEELDWGKWSSFHQFDVVVVERFVLSKGNPFTADLSGLWVEGLLKYFCNKEIVWRLRGTKSQVPDEVLKEHGLWQTGSMVGWTDGRDANDAIIHAIGHLAFTEQHVPTLRKYFPND